jgi:hypothetical protein
VWLCAAWWDTHPEIDVTGDHDGLRALANLVSLGQGADLILDPVPSAWGTVAHSLLRVRTQPSDSPDARISFMHVDDDLLISGAAGELSRIVAGPISQLANGPSHINGVLAHVHLDPATDSEGLSYLPESTSIVVGFGGDENA